MPIWFKIVQSQISIPCVWVALLLTLFSEMTRLCFPKRSSKEAWMNDFMPITGMYSWFREGSCTICSRILCTTGETHSCPSLVMQAVRGTTEGALEAGPWGLQVWALQAAHSLGFLGVLERCLGKDNSPFFLPFIKTMYC